MPTIVIAEEIFNYLKENSSGDWLKVPIHLIGHSRGTSVNARIAHELGIYGIWVDHFTCLDPQPVTHCSDWEVRIYENILFADNNYRKKDVAAPPWGEPVDGTYQRLLNGIVTGNGYYCDPIGRTFNGTAHEQVHTYYHGTIPGDACVDHVLVQPEWYGSKYPTRHTGYYFSRIAMGNRYAYDDTGIPPSINPRDGLHYKLAGSANNRTQLDYLSATWPNTTFKPFEDKKDYTLEAGKPVNFTYYYQDAQRDLHVSLALDNDTNPFNDADNNCYKIINDSPIDKTKSDTVSGEATFTWTPKDIDKGRHYVQIKAYDDKGNVRYDYLLKPITVNVTSQVLSDLVIEGFSVTPASGEPGSSATVTFTIRNKGGGVAYPSLTNIRLSPSNSNVTTNDPLLASIETPQIAAGATYLINQKVTIPEVDTSGTYYVVSERKPAEG